MGIIRGIIGDLHSNTTLGTLRISKIKFYLPSTDGVFQACYISLKHAYPVIGNIERSHPAKHSLILGMHTYNVCDKRLNDPYVATEELN